MSNDSSSIYENPYLLPVVRCIYVGILASSSWYKCASTLIGLVGKIGQWMRVWLSCCTYAETVSSDSCWVTLNLPLISAVDVLTTADLACKDYAEVSTR